MNLKEIKELITLMNENELMELEVEREGMKVRLKKSVSGKIETIAEGQDRPRVVQIIKGDEKISEPVKQGPNLAAIKAPMVGTFYRSPAPDAPAFVEKGSIGTSAPARHRKYFTIGLAGSVLITQSVSGA